MLSSIKRALTASVAALAVGGMLVATEAPASAASFHGGHGGGFHGGGFHGGGFHGGGWHGGGHWAGGWHGGRGYGWAPFAAAGVAGALLGADAYYGGYNGCWQSRPVYDGYGHYLGRRNVNMC
jgi:hypothetical protein